MSAAICGPADYPSELDDDLTLPNRRSLHIRALRQGEEDPIRQLDAHLSVRTRYLPILFADAGATRLGNAPVDVGGLPPAAGPRRRALSMAMVEKSSVWEASEP